MVLDVDLNSLPAESQQQEGDSTPIDLQHRAFEGVSGSYTSSHNIEAIDDDVVFVPSSEWTPRAMNQSRRRSAVIVVIDENLETNVGPSGAVEEPAITQNLTSPEQHQISPKKMIVDCSTNANEDFIAMVNNGANSNPDACGTASAPANIVYCPVCLCAAKEPSTTICGHLFCLACITTAISTNKRCPTCRRKLTKKSFHRIYLP